MSRDVLRDGEVVTDLEGEFMASSLSSTDVRGVVDGENGICAPVIGSCS
jgi:hypothetical protein